MRSVRLDETFSNYGLDIDDNLNIGFLVSFLWFDIIFVEMMNNTKKKIGNYIFSSNDKLGYGAFSEVFKGIQLDTKEEVAIKVLSKHKIQEDEYTKKAFYSEIQIMKRLKSPYIIKFIDVHETKNNFYIILEIAQGGTLRTNLRKIGRIS